MTTDPLQPARRRAAARTEDMRRLPKRVLREDDADLGPWLALRDALRPTSTADCPLTVPVIYVDGERVSLRHEDGRVVCPFYGCQWHLAIEVSRRTGTIRTRYPDADGDPWELPACCALDEATRADAVGRCTAEATLDAVGGALNVTRERLRQIELVALTKLRAALVAAGLTLDDLAPIDHDERLPLAPVSGLTSAIGRSFVAKFGRRLRAAGWRTGSLTGWRTPDGRDVPTETAWRMAAGMEATNG